MKSLKTASLDDVRKAKAANYKYDNEFREVFMCFYETIPTLSYEDEVLWKYIDRMIYEIKSYYDDYGGPVTKINLRLISHCVELAATEVGRISVLNSDGFNLKNFMSFVRTYENLSSGISDALDDSDIELCLTDDPHGDFCDLLPLAGRAVVGKVLLGEYKSKSALLSGIRSVTTPWLFKTIIDGECYCQMRIRDSLQTYI